MPFSVSSPNSQKEDRDKTKAYTDEDAEVAGILEGSPEYWWEKYTIMTKCASRTDTSSKDASLKPKEVVTEALTRLSVAATASPPKALHPTPPPMEESAGSALLSLEKRKSEEYTTPPPPSNPKAPPKMPKRTRGHNALGSTLAYFR